ncbi:MoxR family ATPase [Candidatus Parabeggiatoa sp. HSG14]|uniref:AAA family ATPase n=1 Tax=Candidatus Parabeggiatoa sp. HSG14 TaxID=3055593 RepID=UPI0025A6CD84|nr:MoxR family ATPase [Thiotrichales bacterium HSG14]
MDASHFDALRQYLGQHIIGQHHLINSMLIGLLSDGHILVEGMPGLAKTTAVKSLAGAIEGKFHRIQFTPDLLPADLIGTDIYQHERGEFEFRAGPLFHNVLLADEINRAPPKVQSALLEAMGERQITVGQHTYQLPELFMVLATQNPVEHEGTYTLPEAQLDRFLLYVRVDYPTREEELSILNLMETQLHNADKLSESSPPLTPEIRQNELLKVDDKESVNISLSKASSQNVQLSETNSHTIAQKSSSYHLTQEDVLEARKAVMQVYLDPKLKEYIVDIVQASRTSAQFDRDLERWQRFGASPRASIAMARCARALAWLQGEKYVSPEQIQSVVPDILRHRILLSFEAEAEGITPDDFIYRLLQVVAIP